MTIRSMFGHASALFLTCAALPCGNALAQEVFSGGGQTQQGHPQTQGNPDCPPPVVNGITPKNWSCKTGTQGVQGNPNCPPPVIIINGQPTTPRNWSCPGGTPAARNTPNGPRDPVHPGVPTVAGSTPCQPGGPGGYNFLNNPEGTPLPPGCVRPGGKTNITAKTDPRYQTAPPGSYIVPPPGPPGSYIQPEGKPGSYIVPPVGPPGSYLQSERPGSYVNSTAKSGPGGGGTQVHTGPGGAIVVSPGKDGATSGTPARRDTQGAQGGAPYRQDNGALHSGVVSDGGASVYRQDTGAMQGSISGGGQPAQARVGVTGKPATNSASAKGNSAAASAAANAQAAKAIQDFVRILENGP